MPSTSRAKEVDEAPPIMMWKTKGQRSERGSRANMSSHRFIDSEAAASVEKYSDISVEETDRESTSEQTPNSDSDPQDSVCDESELL